MFVNGVMVNSGSGSGAVNSGTSPQTHIGDLYSNSPANIRFFHGKIDEVRLSNSVRYASNFTPSTTPFVADANTKALYHLDQGSGQYITDLSGNGYNATLGADYNAASDDPAWVTTDGAVSTAQEVPREIPMGTPSISTGQINT